MPPPNLTPETATVITTPYVEAGLDTEGSTVWYRYNATANKLLAVFFRGDNAEADYGVMVTVYTGEPDNLTELDLGAGATFTDQNPINLVVRSGTNYFFKCEAAFTGVSNLLRVNADVLSNTGYNLGSIAVQSDFNENPLIIFENNDIKFAIVDFPKGEGGRILEDGTIGVTNEQDNTIDILNQSFSTLDAIASLFTVDESVRMNDDAQNYFLVYDQNGANLQYFFLHKDGTTSGLNTITPPEAVATYVMAFSPDRAYIYYARRGSNARPVRRYTIAGGADIELIAAQSPMLVGGSFLVLEDGTLVLFYVQDGSFNSEVRHYSAAGTLINSWPITQIAWPQGYDARMARALDDNGNIDNTSVWVWQHQSFDEGYALMVRVSLVDGSEIERFQFQEFVDGQWPGPFDGDNTDIFGIQISCDFWIMQQGLAAQGINKLVPGSGKTNDTIGGTEVAIPNPFIITAPIGD